MSFQLMNLRNNTNVSSKKKQGNMYVLKKNQGVKRKNFNLINVRNGDLENSLSNISEEQEVLHGMVHSNQSEVSLQSIADDSQEDESSFIEEYDETDDESFNGSYEVSVNNNNINEEDEEEVSNLNKNTSFLEQIRNKNITLTKVNKEEMNKYKEEKSNGFPQNSIMDAINTTLNARRQVIQDSSSDSESVKDEEYENEPDENEPDEEEYEEEDEDEDKEEDEQ